MIQGLAVDGKRPLISGGANTVHFRSDDPYDHGADHYVFQGFELTGGASRCLYHQSDDLTVRDVVIHDCPLQSRGPSVTKSNTTGSKAPITMSWS